MLDISRLVGEDSVPAEEWLTEQTKLACSRPDYSLVGLVETLGPVLTHSSVAVRGSGLTVVGLAVQQTSLGSEEAALLAQFYTDRLRDHHSLLPPTLAGLAAVAACPALPASQLQPLLAGLQGEVMVQQQVVRDRRTVFSLLAGLLRDRVSDLVPLSSQFTLSLLAACEGETDPRNLVTIFQSLGRTLDLMSVQLHREEIFESLAVYFPVDFSPPAGMVGSVTREQLAGALQAALAHPGLAEWTLALILDKLSSELEAAKLDSLAVLVELAGRSEASREEELLEVWAREVEGIWAGLKRELLGLRLGGSKAVEAAAGRAVEAVSSLLGRRDGLEIPGRGRGWDRWLATVWTDCEVGLGQPGTRLAGPAGAALSRVATSGPHQASEVAARALPALVTAWSGCPGPAAQRDLLGVLGGLVGAVVGAGGEGGPGLDPLSALLLNVLQNPGPSDLVEAAARAAAAGAPLLSELQRSELCDCLVAGLQAGTTCLAGPLAALARTQPHLVQRASLPALTAVDCWPPLWEAGLYPASLPTLLATLPGPGPPDPATTVRRLAAYTPTHEDLASLSPAAPGLAALLLTEVCPVWPDQLQVELQKVLADLGSCLDMAGWSALPSGPLTPYRASLQAALPAPVLAAWPQPLLEEVAAGAGEGGHCGPLLASIANKVPTRVEGLQVGEFAAGWVASGLARRGQSAQPWLDRVLALLDGEDETASQQAVVVVGALLGPAPWRHAITALLFKQRLWGELLPRLTKKPGPDRLAALLACLPHLPSPCLVSAIPSLLPLTLTALTSPATARPALACLADITKVTPDRVSSHATELVSRCLTVAAATSAGLQARLLALQVLQHCAMLQTPLAVQLAGQVTRDLLPVLSATKRLVRQEAARTRNVWFLVTQPS